jgi:hypothetical protein
MCGTEKPLYLCFTFYNCEKSSNVILCNPMLTKVPTWHAYCAKRLAEMVKSNYRCLASIGLKDSTVKVLTSVFTLENTENQCV